MIRAKRIIRPRVDIFVWLIVAIFSVIYAFMSVYKHNHFQTFGWDLAIFDHGIWQWSQFLIPYSSFHDLPWLADHFHLILITIAPLYWIWSDVRVLLIVQAILVSAGALPLYYLSKKVTKNNQFSFVIVLGYLLFYSLQSFVFSDFHELAFLPLTFGGMVLFWELKKTFSYWIFFVLSLLVKEEIGFLLAAFGLWALIRGKNRRIQAVISILLGFVYTFIMVSFIMPSIAGGQLYRHSGFGQSGQTLTDVFLNIAKNPLYFANAFIDSPVKINTMWTTFWSWGFLPLLSPLSLILVFEQFASRFLDYGKPIRWTLLFAYSLPMTTIMAWGSIYGFNNLVKILQRVTRRPGYVLKAIISLYLLLLIIAGDLFLHGPINNLFKSQFYARENWMADNEEVFKCVSPNASVSVQNSLAPWLSQRKKIKVFPEGIGFDYIVLDLHNGQSENNFHFLGRKNTKKVIEDLVKKGYYEVVCQEGSAVVFKRMMDQPYNLNYPFEINIKEK